MPKLDCPGAGELAPDVVDRSGTLLGTEVVVVDALGPAVVDCTHNPPSAGSSVCAYVESGRFVGNAVHVGRNCSFAVRPTSSMAWFASFTPGSETTMKLPWRVISGSATPRPSTRRRMIEIAWLS